MPRTKKVEIFFTFFLMANLLPMLPSFQLGIVLGGTSTFAACYAALVLPGLYNRRLCQVLNLTGLSVTMVSPDAMFPRCLLYNSFAVSFLGIAKSTLYKMTHENRIPFYKPAGKLIYFEKIVLLDWIRSNRIMSEAEL